MTEEMQRHFAGELRRSRECYALGDGAAFAIPITARDVAKFPELELHSDRWVEIRISCQVVSLKDVWVRSETDILDSKSGPDAGPGNFAPGMRVVFQAGRAPWWRRLWWWLTRNPRRLAYRPSPPMRVTEVDHETGEITVDLQERGRQLLELDAKRPDRTRFTP